MVKKKLNLNKTNYTTISLRLNITTNNAIISITDLLGNVLFWKSCGSLNKDKKIHNSIFLLEKLSLVVLDFLFKNKFHKIVVIVKGGNKQKLNVFLRPIFFSKLNILNFIDATKVPFNGCRLPKQNKLKQKKSTFIV